MIKKLLFALLFAFTLHNVKANNWTPSSDTLSTINEQIKLGDASLAIVYLPKVLDYMDTSDDNFIDTAYVQLSMQLAVAYQIIGNMPMSDRILDNASLVLERRGVKKMFTEFEFTKSIRQFQLGNYDKAIRYLIRIKDEEKDNFRDSNYLSIMSVIINCYRLQNDVIECNRYIEEALELIRLYGNDYSSLSKVQVMSNSGTFLIEQGREWKGIQLIKEAYDIACLDSSCDGFYNRLAINLGTYYGNKEDYEKSKFYYGKVKKEKLNINEKLDFLNGLFLLNYYLDNELETSKYASEYSETIRRQIANQFQNYSLMTLDNIWDNQCIQLKVNMGALHKYKNCPLINSMCYDNALFIKNITYNARSNYRRYITENSEIQKLANHAKELRQLLFFSDNNDAHLDEYRDSIGKIEETIQQKFQYADSSTSCHQISWKDIRNILKKDECAIEIISTVGFYNSKESPKLKLGALIVSNDCEAPEYIELCDNELMQYTIKDSHFQAEIGINDLYSFNERYTLYNLLWKNMESSIVDKKKIYISPTLTTQYINWGFIPCPDGKFLNEKYEIKCLSSTSSLLQKNVSSTSSIAIFGNMKYDKNEKTSNKSVFRGLIEENEETRGTFRDLHYSKEEIDAIKQIFNSNRIDVSMYSGDKANEKAFRSLDGNSPSIIHLASHAYYIVGSYRFNAYFKNLTPLIARDESMLRSGILFNNANNTLNTADLGDITEDGVVTAEEISAMDLSNTDLVVISACESMFGSTNEGLGGLPRAFKLAGVHSVLGSLWKVSDNVTSLLMKEFYHNLSKGENKDMALIHAQYKIKELYPDPYYWAAFVLLD